MNKALLAKMTAEISVVLCKYIPGGGSVMLRTDTRSLTDATYTQVVAFRSGDEVVFSVNVELCTTTLENPTLKCITNK